MEKNKITNIELPDNFPIEPKDNIAIKVIFKKVLKELLKESVWDYFSVSDMDYKLSKIDEVKMEDDLTYYVGDTALENGILKIPNYFFTREITKTEDLINLITEYPDMKTLLTTYAIYIIGHRNNDNEEERMVKNIIATYFAVEKNNNGLKALEYSQMTFKSYATSNALLENIIREISLIFGKDTLYETLKYDNEVLIKKIDDLTNKKGLGKKFIDKFIELHKLSISQRKRYIYLNLTEYIAEEKLLPFYEKIEHYDTNTQNAILQLVKIKDYDLSIVNLFDDKINISDIEEINPFEKIIIKRCIDIFDKEWKNFSYLITGYPQTFPIGRDTSRNRIYDGLNFSFLNKFFSSHKEQIKEHNYICKEIQKIWKELQELIILEILPRYIKNNKEANINLNEILELSKYQTEETTYNIEKESKGRRLIRKISQISN